MTNLNNILGCAFGVALGDAMGAYLEFRSPGTIARYFPTKDDYKFPPDVDTTHLIHRGEKPCHWTDDTTQMIFIMEMLIETGDQIDLVNFSKKLVNWLDNGVPEIGETRSSDCGGLTICVIRDFRHHPTDPKRCAKGQWESRPGHSPNGSVMRTAIMGCRKSDDYVQCISDSIQVGLTTHYDQRCSVSVAVITSIVWDIVHGTPEDEILDRAFKCCEWFGEQHREECERYFNMTELDELELNDMIGYSLKCMACGVWAFRNRDKDFRDAILDIIFQGGDTDTNAAVAGGVLGAYKGYDNLPQDYIEKMPHHDYLYQKAVDLERTTTSSTQT